MSKANHRVEIVLKPGFLAQEAYRISSVDIIVTLPDGQRFILERKDVKSMVSSTALGILSADVCFSDARASVEFKVTLSRSAKHPVTEAKINRSTLWSVLTDSIDGGHLVDAKILRADDWEYMDDSDLEDEIPSATRSSVAGSSASPVHASQSSEPSLSIASLTEPADESHNKAVQDTEYRPPSSFPWRAIIWYIYTGETQFSSLRSTKSKDRYKGHLCQCSPKSVYRLADQYGLTALKQLAFGKIKKDITSENVVHEIFTLFSRLYPEIYGMELDYLLTKKEKPSVQEAIAERLQRADVVDSSSQEETRMYHKTCWYEICQLSNPSSTP
ncbi:hypothetical protein CYLTODRAFT_454833 [Cylindrobasidium torrendii FP15055 ss-10]|uniref:BTB domain-containing protein n=1 Tax=Cylindrobasidium torrendii FP15055 ss-10 TaxID=1314674 RepID=A0A0D7B9U8_9AGAR|nr:hypothetical protein CYLTODRAFT_454833 [Cylindrobasidium torrendii FP15055 ss-10]